ncbi:MAG: DUF922 domain-containing protein [Elusimicrobia bacterium]|nr:DUF922 domain-containing protein [Elusimicrobiota bacterium]
MKNVIRIILIFVFFENILYCDKIYLTNGKTMEGKVLTSDSEYMEVQVYYGTIKYPKNEILKYEESEYNPQELKPDEIYIYDSQGNKKILDRFKLYREMPLYAGMGYTKLVYEFYDIYGNNFDEAFDYLLKVCPVLDKSKALATCTINPKITYIIHPVNDVMPKVKITDINISHYNRVLLPYWHIPQTVDEKELYYWETFLRELMRHECKHATINNDALARIKAGLEEISVSCDLGYVGAEMREAKEKAQKQANEVYNSNWTNARQQNRVFDDNEYGKLFMKIEYAKPK